MARQLFLEGAELKEQGLPISPVTTSSGAASTRIEAASVAHKATGRTQD